LEEAKYPSGWENTLPGILVDSTSNYLANFHWKGNAVSFYTTIDAEILDVSFS